MNKYEKVSPNDENENIKLINDYFEGKSIEIGKAKYQDFITDCTLKNCELRIRCGAGSVNLFGSKFYDCVFRPSKEMKNLRFTDVFLYNCYFKGRYSGCRFGADMDKNEAIVKGCDFSEVKLFHLCDFLRGADVESCKFPPWPHIVVTDLKNSRKDWLGLELPENLRIVQDVVGDEDQLSSAVTIHLPSVNKDYEQLKDVFSSRSYILII